MRAALALVVLALSIQAQEQQPSKQPVAAPRTVTNAPVVTDMLQVKRVYVEPLAGDSSAEAIRQLIITSLQQSRLFTLTDNPDRADALVRGAANDKEYTDQFDSQEGINAHANAGQFGGSSSSSSRGSGGYGGISVGENESHHIKERKHEAYAAVRLCNLDGDVLWATTQESHGAKFRGASADVAEKVARQLKLDFEQALRPVQNTVSHTAGPANLQP